MKNGPLIFLKTVILLIGVVVLIGLIRIPMTEGRAANLDLFSIYADPFIVYVYLGSIPFFFALYQAFKLLGYIGQDQIFTPNSVRALRNIKYCAIITSVLIMSAGVYIRIFHSKEDDPAGFIALCIITTFLSIVVATATAVFEHVLQSAMEIKSEKNLH